MGHGEFVTEIEKRFHALGVKRVTVDEPFDASGPNTVCATVASRCHIPAIQLELNTRLLMNGYDDCCFTSILDTLCDLTKELNGTAEATEKVAL